MFFFSWLVLSWQTRKNDVQECGFLDFAKAFKLSISYVHQSMASKTKKKRLPDLQWDSNPQGHSVLPYSWQAY